MPADGAQLWSFTAEGPVESQIAVAGGIAYVGSNDGKVYALKGVSGQAGEPAEPYSDSSARPCSMAYRTSSTRLCRWSLPSVFCTWFCTVRWDSTSRAAICL